MQFSPNSLVQVSTQSLTEPDSARLCLFFIVCLSGMPSGHPRYHARSVPCLSRAFPRTLLTITSPSRSPHYHLSLAISPPLVSPLPHDHHPWSHLSLTITTLGLTSPSRSPPLICAEGENTLGLTQIDLEKFLRMADEQSAAEKVTRRSPISHPTLCHSKLLWLPITAADDAGVR